MEPTNENIVNIDRSRSYRFGKTQFWMHFGTENYAVSHSESWTATIVHRQSRSRKLSSELPILDISPRHPLFSLKVGSETFPLLISNVGDVKSIGRGIEFGGERKVMLKKLHTLKWTAKLRPRTGRAAVDLTIEFKANAVPPLPPSSPGSLRVELFVPMFQTEPWSFPFAPDSHRGAISLWSRHSGVAISAVLPSEAESAEQSYTVGQSGCALVHTAHSVVRRSRGVCTIGVRLDAARTRSHAQFMHLQHTQSHLPAALPHEQESPPEYGLRDLAIRAMNRMTDKGAYDTVGIERVYVRHDAGHEGPISAPQFHAGYPYFPLDGARAMLDWHLLFGDEVGARLALLIARGIAGDFAVIGGAADEPVVNKGAFWDRRNGPPGKSGAIFTDFLGDEFHSIASTARIARGLFGVHERSKDLISFNAAINACQWLILKQNSTGYFDGDRVCSSTGAVIACSETLAGIEVVVPLMQAYKATRNEVFATTAARIARHLTGVLMQGLVSPPIFGSFFGSQTDTPATVAGLVRTLAFVHSLSPTRRAHEELEMAGTWLRAWDYDNAAHYDGMNQDGRYYGVTEVARAALQLLAVDRDPAWLDMALRLAGAAPQESHSAWHCVPLFIETMLGLLALVPGALPNMHEYTARVGWSDYVPDATTNQYITVQSVDHQAPIDYMPLVSSVNSRALLMVLAHGPVERINISQNGRFPNMRDLVQNDIVCQPATLHPFPFKSKYRWGCFTLEA